MAQWPQPAGRRPLTSSSRAADLQARARAEAKKSAEELVLEIGRLTALAEEVASLGSSIPAGVTQEAGRIAELNRAHGERLAQLINRLL